MYEIEFLPAWYPQLRKRRRAVVAQAWGTGAVVLLVAACAGGERLAARTAVRADGRCQAELNGMRQQLGQLDRTLAEQARLQRREAVASDLGVGVDPTRVLAAVGQAMTPGTMLTGMTIDTAEQVRPGQPACKTRPAVKAEVDRRLTVKVTGIAPNDLDATTLLARLSADPFLDDVAATYLRDRPGTGGREFEVTFGIDLNLNPAALAGAE